MPASPATLPRVLGPWMATAIMVGTVIGTGVFKKGKNVAEECPEFGLGIAVWVLGGVLMILGALTLAEVAVRLPRAGGNYIFLREAFGRRAGFLWGWVEFWIIRSASIAALASMFTDALHDIIMDAVGTPGRAVIPFWPRQFITVALIATLTIVNIRGTRLGATVQLVLTLIKVGSLIAIAVLPFVVLAVVGTPQHPPRLENITPAWPADWTRVNWGGFLVALLAVMWAYDGWMNVGVVAEEVQNPSRNIPIAFLGGSLVLITLYVAANVAYYLVIPRAEMAAVGNTPVATVFCFRLLGNSGIMIASLILMTSVLGSLNGNVLIAPRLLYAMGKDGLASPRLSELHRNYHTPALGHAAFGLWASLLIIIGGALVRNELPPIPLGFATLDLNLPRKFNDVSQEWETKSLFDVMTDYAMVGVVTMGTLAVAAIYPLRGRDPNANIPYRCPGYPVVPAIYILLMTAVFLNMFTTEQGRTEATVGTAFIALGALVYQLRGSLRAKTEDAAGT